MICQKLYMFLKFAKIVQFCVYGSYKIFFEIPSSHSALGAWVVLLPGLELVGNSSAML